MKKNQYKSIAYGKIKELEEKGLIDPYTLELRVDYNLLRNQIDRSLGLTEADPIPVVDEEIPVSRGDTLFRVWWKNAQAVFDISSPMLRKNKVPGVKWIGHPPNNPSGAALVEVNLNHPELSRTNLCEDDFKNKGRKSFYKPKEVQKLFGFKSPNTTYGKFSSDETLRIGAIKRYPISLVHTRVDEYKEEISNHHGWTHGFPKLASSS